MVDSGMNFRCVLFFGIVVDSTSLFDSEVRWRDEHFPVCTGLK